MKRSTFVALWPARPVFARPLRQHAPKFCALRGELFAGFVELGIVETRLAAVLVVLQHLAHPDLGDGLQLLVIELGDALGGQRRSTQLEFLALLPELDVNARVLGPRQLLRRAEVRRTEAADDMLLVGGVRRANGGGMRRRTYRLPCLPRA